LASFDNYDISLDIPKLDVRKIYLYGTKYFRLLGKFSEVLFPFVPAKAGTQLSALDSRHKRVHTRLPTRYARE